jgi:2-succinyl-5-enolpyruvyl-6-hydroxy-3-cyclohexene-1-carboxylate synthase
MTEKRDEADLPSPLVVMFWLNEQNQMRPIACATEDKREDSVKRAAQCYNYSVHDYVPFSSLASVTRERDAAARRVGELEKKARELIQMVPSGYSCGLDICACELAELLTPKEPSDAERR